MVYRGDGPILCPSESEEGSPADLRGAVHLGVFGPATGERSRFRHRRGQEDLGLAGASLLQVHNLDSQRIEACLPDFRLPFRQGVVLRAEAQDQAIALHPGQGGAHCLRPLAQAPDSDDLCGRLFRQVQDLGTPRPIFTEQDGRRELRTQLLASRSRKLK